MHKEGLDGRSWFKHVVFAPGLWTGYAGATFPGLVEAVDRGDREGVEVSLNVSPRWTLLTLGQRWSKIIEKNIDDATESLK